MGGSLVSAWERLAALPVEIEGVELDHLRKDVSSGFTRVTTLIRVAGGGEEGVGEDVIYSAEAHDSFPELSLPAQAALGELCETVGGLELYDAPAGMEAGRLYRRWGIESALLDLALRQASISLAEAVGREPRPVTFVVSTRASAGALRRLQGLYPGLRFKLDPTPEWDDALVAELAATGAVDTVDLKGAYHGTIVDNPPDAALYRRVAEGFPEAWIEDPALNDETGPALEPFRNRITWDAPIHSVADVEALPFAPRCLNVKPSRFGSIQELLRFYAYCSEHGIALYGGGQFELGPGRGHIQYLASLFHPDTPNDVAPVGFHEPEPGPGLQDSPLAVAAQPTGFRWG